VHRRGAYTRNELSRQSGLPLVSMSTDRRRDDRGGLRLGRVTTRLRLPYQVKRGPIGTLHIAAWDAERAELHDDESGAVAPPHEVSY
jgi:hypothetical protein